MTIEQLKGLSIYDENERVVLMKGDVNDPTRIFTGTLHEIPAEYHPLRIWMVGAMSDRRRTKWGLNDCGWTELWIDES